MLCEQLAVGDTHRGSHVPSVVDGQGRPVVGERYNLPESAPALRPPTLPRRFPDYGAPAVGGLGHHAATPGMSAGLDGVAWPSRADGSSRSIGLVSLRSGDVGSAQYPHRGASSFRARIRKASAALFGR